MANKTDELIRLLKPSPNLGSGKDILDYFRKREKPRYLFGLSDVTLNDSYVISDAEEVIRHKIYGWQFEGDIDYFFNPTADTSRDNEWSWSLFRNIYWQPLARAYATTGDEKYFREFVSEMKQFRASWPAEKYIENQTFEVKTPFPGHAWRTIEAGIRIYTVWLPCFEIFRHSELWNEEDFAEFLIGISDHARFLMSHYSNHDRSSNWLSMEASALLQIGIMFPEFREAETWFRTGYNRVMHEIMYCFSNNGIHMERTPIYHLVATIAFLQATEMCKINGIEVAPYAEEILFRAAEYVLSLIKPDLSTPMIGDADRDSLTGRRADTSIYEGMNLSFFPDDLNELRAFFKLIYRLTGREEFLYFSSLRKEGKPPKRLDYNYNAEGVYVMRTGWGEKDDYILMHAVSLERGEKSTHSHNDACHAEVTLLGEDVLVDSGRYIYMSSIWKDWRAYFTSAEAHNTLSVDGREMGTVPNVVGRVRGVRAICNEFSVKDGVRTIDLSHNGYVFIGDSVFHRRKSVLLPCHTVIIIDMVTGPGWEDHDFRFTYNFNRGETVLDGKNVRYVTEKGTSFLLEFISDKGFVPTLLYGSENPKGGWISYGYPVREPAGQVAYMHHGKVPFTAVTCIHPESEKTELTFSAGMVRVLSGGREYRISTEVMK